MIKISNLNSSHIGRKVVYRPINTVIKEGIITGWSFYHIFVKYKGEQYPDPTSPKYLYWRD